MRLPVKSISLLQAVCFCGLFVGAGCSAGGKNMLVSQTGGVITRAPYDPVLLEQPDGPPGYIIGHGDLLDVVFLYNREYNRENIRVLPDGSISLPHVGTIDVAGTTVSWLDSLLTARFSEIIVDPDITVIIKEFQRQNIYLIGEVDLPGVYPWNRDMTLVGALALGRGPTKNARRSDIVVIRRIAEDHVVGVEVDVKAILESGNFALDVPLRPFDIVYVPKSRIASSEEFIERMFVLLGRPLDIYLKGWQAAHARTLYDFYARGGRI